ncbi:MAG: hypothetical protein J6P87_04025 [Lachnospiraceae bacterium]|nr:hypothetical protein [Lachnospiraceae bacterium]
MNVNQMMLPEDVEDVLVDGIPVGFSVKLRIPYYRGVALSLVDNIEIKYDNEVFTKDQLKFTTKDGTYTFAEMATMTTLRWEFGEKATVFVPRMGGFGMGGHMLEATVAIRISYMGGAFPSKCAKYVSVTGG